MFTRMSDVTVLIPTYNGSFTIERAIKSALAQDGVFVDVVVCDDASTDDTSARLRELDFKYAQVVHHATNQGMEEALNSAAQLAHGRYFIILGDDDYFAPGCFRTMVKALDDQPEISFVYGRTQYFGMQNFVHTPPAFNADDFNDGFASLYGYMYRRDVWDLGARYEDLMKLPNGRGLGAGDYDFALQMIERGYKGLCLPDVMVLNYMYNPSQTQTGVVNQHQAELVAKFKARWAKWRGSSL